MKTLRLLQNEKYIPPADATTALWQSLVSSLLVADNALKSVTDTDGIDSREGRHCGGSR